MSEKTPENEKFSFCIGRPWEDDPESVKAYAHGSQVQTGTMRDAESFRDYVNKRSGKVNFIYKLVKVEG